MLEFEVDLVDCFEAVRGTLMLTHEVDNRHDYVLRKSAGYVIKLVLFSKFLGIKGKMKLRLY